MLINLILISRVEGCSTDLLPLPYDFNILKRGYGWEFIIPRHISVMYGDIALTILHEGLTPTRGAERFGVSPRPVHCFLSHYKTGGRPSLEPKSCWPKYSTTNERAKEILPSL